VTLLRWVALLLLGLGLVACTGVPDRSAAARQLETDLGRLPGVESASVGHTNDFTHGTHIEIGVNVDEASEAQIAEVATRLNQLRGNTFDRYEQSVSFSVAPLATVNTGTEVIPDVVARGAGEARRILAKLSSSTDRVTLYPGRTGSTVDMDYITDTNRAAAAAVEVIGAHTGGIKIRGKDSGSEQSPTWDITGPLGPERFRDLRRQLDELPATAGFIRIKDGHFQQVNLMLSNPETAYQDVAAAAKIMGGSPEHPLRLAWNVETAVKEPRWAGSVDIGACINDIDISAPDKLTPEAQVVQQRIRAEFSGCRR